MASIELKNVTKIYEGFKALDALNLTVPSGSVYGLIGPNGAGKTTAIRHMMGVLRQDAGSVLLDGEPVFENPSVKARMLCIPDEPYFTSTSTTRDLMNLRARSIPASTPNATKSCARSSRLTIRAPSAAFRAACRSSRPSGSHLRRGPKYSCSMSRWTALTP